MLAISRFNISSGSTSHYTLRTLLASPGLLLVARPRSLRSTSVRLQAMAATQKAKGRTALDETSNDGAFKRRDAMYRNFVKKGGDYPPEAGRYHLYIAYACPWANRTLATLYLKGLEHVIGLSVVHSTWQRTRPNDPEDTHTGWTFTAPGDPPLASSSGHGSFPCDDTIPDTVNGAKFIRDLYDKVDDTSGKYTVPVFWDKKTGTIVNNESAEIVRFLNSEFNDLAKNPSLDLYPESLRKQIDSVNEWVYPTINNGVYRCGFATKQSAYEEAFDQLFASLDRCEEILSKQRYIADNQLTEADIRLYMTLIRFDEVYVVYFKTNGKQIHEYPHISNYVKEVYQMPGIAKATNIRHIKTHYFTSHPTLNHYAIIPKGAEADPWWAKPHNRDELFPKA